MDNIAIKRILARCATGDNGCLNWTGARNPRGYGKIFVNGKLRDTHRAMWIATHGEIPRWVVVCHRCDNPSCVNIDHLFTGTQKENLADMRLKHRHAQGPTFGERIATGWTPDLRKQRAAETAARMLKVRTQKQQAAGADKATKFCPQCCTWKPYEGFHKNRARFDGVKPYCKPCAIERDVHRVKSKRALFIA
jgi:hypothetical protein